jgi:diguanylate cyclase (GGDEF)-like protein/PAS domain S-box-containing protein
MVFLHTDNLLEVGLLALFGVLAIVVLGMRADSKLFQRRVTSEEAGRRQWGRMLADASFDGLLVHRQGLILQMNRALVRMLGTREREWLGQHFSTLARPDQTIALRAELEAPQPQIVAFSLLRANKTEVAVEIYSQNIDFEGLPATVTAIRDISQRLADAAQISRLVQYDALTGLANRKRFGELVAAAVTQNDRKSGTTTVFTLDLDQFKAVNERLGRGAGDVLLQQVALRLGAMVAREDVLARLGSDKFALLMVSEGAPNRAVSLGGQFVAALNEPFIVEGKLVKLSVSIGIAVYPDHAADVEGLLKASEFALAQAARAGGGVAHMFSHQEAGVQRRLAGNEEAQGGQNDDVQLLGAALRQAMAQGDLKLVFQPVVRADDLTPVGFEALARWNHPVEGLIGPERFIPVADAAGLSQEVGCYVLEQACAEARHAGGLRMAVNVSALQLRDANLPVRIAAILRKTGLPPELLEIEVAEGLLIGDRAAAVAALHGLQTIGVGIVLDNFGTGHSTLSSLCDLPFSRLKIDRRFVGKLGTDDNADAIVRAIMALAGNLGLAVTAVGVENQTQLDYLREHGCQCVQGSLLGSPTARAAMPHSALGRPALVAARG